MPSRSIPIRPSVVWQPKSMNAISLRVVLPAAAAFLTGFGQELGQATATASQTATTDARHASISLVSSRVSRKVRLKGAQSAASFFQNEANNTKPLVPRDRRGNADGAFLRVASVYDQIGIAVNNAKLVFTPMDVRRVRRLVTASVAVLR